MRKTTLAVIGLGDFGKELVRRLHAEGHETIAVDVALDAVEAVGDQCTEALCLDATDLRALRRLDFDVIDAVILSGSQSFENELIIIDNLRRLEAKRIVARYKTSLQLRVLKMLGLDDVFNPEERAARNMAEGFRHGAYMQTTLVREGYHLVELPLPEGLAGWRVSEFGEASNGRLSLLAVARMRPQGEEFSLPGGEFIFEIGDRLVLFGPEKEVDRLLREYR